MRLLLRISQHDEHGFDTFTDVELNQDEAAIGSSPDCDIQLLGKPVRRHHAVLKAGQLKAKRGASFVHNEQSKRSAELQTGDSVEIGSHRLSVVRPPTGFDLALEVYRDTSVHGGALESAYTTSIAETLIGKRTLAYVLFFGLLLFGLAFPMLDYSVTKDVVVDSQQPEAAGNLHPPAFLSDDIWSTGPLAPPHQVTLGDQCTTCHKDPFHRVDDAQCTNCHQSMTRHLPDNHPEAEDWQEETCQHCHKEHNEPNTLIVEKDVLCEDCHDDTDPSVTGFSESQHPLFIATLLHPQGSGNNLQWQPQHKTLSTPDLKEASNLKFPHDIHLDPDEVQHQNTGEAMVCADCHTLTADNEHFQPIEMEKHCISCHELRFDEQAPDRQLPHGKTMEAVRMLEAHFVRQYADPNYASQNQRRRRRPGRDQQANQCDGPPLECGRQRAALAIKRQFTQRGCVTCHEVDDTGSSDPYTRWQVLPVKLNNDWFSLARFNHRSHLTQTGQSESGKCLNCHKAKQSDTASDIMLPNIDNCVQCHGESPNKTRVPLRCINCHQYHHPVNSILYQGARE